MNAALAPGLRVTEVFVSLQGETSRAGLPTVFVRRSGCALRVRWCYTPFRARVGESGVRTVCVTGGEPLAQKNCLPFLAALADAGYSVSLETSGALDIAGVDPRVARIVDVKAPGSDEVEKNRWDNLSHLTPHDEVKFVLADRADYDWAVAMLAEHRLAERCPVLFSPVAAELDPTALADWIVADRLPVRMQVQLHKVLWGNTAGK